tara:strand:+ start:13975 stop:14781 length:807 start_codon:yes stop_codon:yes gene_type:complete
MNSLRNHSNTLNEPIAAIVIGLVKLGVFLSSVDWSKYGGWDERKATENLVKSWIANNNLWLYPAKNVGGPWPIQAGAGKLGSMDQDSLRYFIEWRLPVYQKGLTGANWQGSKQRVVNRYNFAIEGLKTLAIAVFEKRFGPYAPSGLYKEEVAKFPLGSTDLSKSASWKIKRLNAMGSDNLPKNTNAQNPSIGPVTLLQGNKATDEQIKKYLQTGEMPSTQPENKATKSASLDWLGYSAAIGTMLFLGKKLFTNKKTKAGLNAPVEVSL